MTTEFKQWVSQVIAKGDKGVSGAILEIDQNGRYAYVHVNAAWRAWLAQQEKIDALMEQLELLNSPGITAIAAERHRQIEKEGWTSEHDDAHAPGIMAQPGRSMRFTPSTDMSSRRFRTSGPGTAHGGSQAQQSATVRRPAP